MINFSHFTTIAINSARDALGQHSPSSLASAPKIGFQLIFFSLL
jgi:hypothetical protein